MESHGFMGTEFQLCKIKRILEMKMVMVAQQYECTSYHQTVHLKMIGSKFHVMCILSP